jgi:4-hydroxybenzoate polyprenyltransferase
MTEPRQSEDSRERPPQEESSPAPPAASGFRGSRLWAWLQLFRVPNLLTVPGDAIAGFLLAQLAGLSATRPHLRMALAAVVSLLIYAAGLLWNDLFDLSEDLRERPSRPLPSGRVRTGHVALAANVLVAAAISVAAVAGRPTLWTAVVLGAVVLAYDVALKRVPLVGPLAMGVCRGLSVLVGAAAFGAEGLTRAPVIAAAAGITLYVAAVTWLARGETRQRDVTIHSCAIAASLIVWLAAVGAAVVASGVLSFRQTPLMLGLGSFALVWFGFATFPLNWLPGPRGVQQTVGRLIGGIILIQAAEASVAGWTGLTIAIALMACFLLNRVLGRIFYAS